VVVVVVVVVAVVVDEEETGYLRVMVRDGSFNVRSSSGLEERTRCPPAHRDVHAVPDGRAPPSPVLPIPDYPLPPSSLGDLAHPDSVLAREMKRLMVGQVVGWKPLPVLLRLSQQALETCRRLHSQPTPADSPAVPKHKSRTAV